MRNRLRVVLIKPSKYDDEGYVIRHFRGVLPSNTLACLNSLTEDLARQGSLGPEIKIEVQILDDSVQNIPVDRIARSNRPPRRRTVVGLVGVQSNQFPRAADLARRFRRRGLQVLIGGFHVSGTLALFPAPGPEIQELIDLGVSVVQGEVEEAWRDILLDALHDELKPIYNLSDAKPDLSRQPVPRQRRGYLKRFIASNFGTIDCGRGCPFNCSFCTIINVQGRKMRFRSTDTLARTMRDNYHRLGIHYYFFTDDNFARNANWRGIFEMLARLRTEEAISIQFMMQVDTQSWKIPDFVSLAARAGCTQVFIGMESMNPANLKLFGKAQNRVQEYREMVDAWHQAKVATHIAYIIGFPHDTTDSVRDEVERLKWELQVEQASFFMLTPLPGSQDHARMIRDGEYMDSDLNNYDAFHETTRQPHFAPGEWYTAYREAWSSFYSFEYMRHVLANAHPENYWNIFRNFIWYKNSALIEGGHPMIHGFFRLKPRTDRRPGTCIDSRLRHSLKRWAEIRHLFRQWVALALEMEELWLQTRRRSEAELRLMAELKRLREETNRGLRAAELQLAHIRAGIHVPGMRVPSRLALALRDLNFSLAKRITYSRSDLQKFWRANWRGWPRVASMLVRPHQFALHFLRDAQLLFLFAHAVLRGRQET